MRTYSKSSCRGSARVTLATRLRGCLAGLSDGLRESPAARQRVSRLGAKQVSLSLCSRANICRMYLQYNMLFTTTSNNKVVFPGMSHQHMRSSAHLTLALSRRSPCASCSCTAHDANTKVARMGLSLGSVIPMYYKPVAVVAVGSSRVCFPETARL